MGTFPGFFAGVGRQTGKPGQSTRYTCAKWFLEPFLLEPFLLTSEGTGLRKKYLLALPTGEWSVHAECGPVASSIQKISIRSGESIELDFEMGAKAA